MGEFKFDKFWYTQLSQIVDVNIVVLLLLFVVVVVSTDQKVNIAVLVVGVLIGHSLVNGDVVRDLAHLLELEGLLWIIFVNNISLFIAELSETDQDDVSGVDPHSVSQLASDGCHSLHSIEAVGLHTTISKKSKNLGVLLALVLSDKLSALSKLGVLALLSLLSSLSYVN